MGGVENSRNGKLLIEEKRQTAKYENCQKRIEQLTTKVENGNNKQKVREPRY